MDIKKRYLESYISSDLKKRMVFLGGPRQVGKTTIAKQISLSGNNSVYLNWDSRKDRLRIIEENWPPETDFIIFDELHKYDSWKSHIKGIWDTREEHLKILVTGSSRLDIFRKGGDSLLGRYHYYRLHPFTLAELNEKHIPMREFPGEPITLHFKKNGKNLEELFLFGGFPESILSQSVKNLKRWHNERFERIFREDIRDSENIQNLAKLELLGSLLPHRVCSPLSLSSLKEDVEVTPATVKKWIELLSRNYYIFQVPPYHARLERALKKESKYYLWDWSEIKEEGRRFENLVAVHLLKYCHFLHDCWGIKADLYYIRDREKREADFLITWDRSPWMIIECKLTKPKKYTNLYYFAERLKIKNRYMITKSNEYDYVDKKTGIRTIPAEKFLMALV